MRFFANTISFVYFDALKQKLFCWGRSLHSQNGGGQLEGPAGCTLAQVTKMLGGTPPSVQSALSAGCTVQYGQDGGAEVRMVVWSRTKWWPCTP